jgi:hypothetical protein
MAASDRYYARDGASMTPRGVQRKGTPPSTALFFETGSGGGGGDDSVLMEAIESLRRDMNERFGVIDRKLEELYAMDAKLGSIVEEKLATSLAEGAAAGPRSAAAATTAPPQGGFAQKRPSGTNYAPTQSSIRNLPNNTMTQQGSYLAGLRQSLDALTSYASEAQRTSEAGPAVLAAPPGAFAAATTKRRGSYAPTQSLVKNLSARTLSQAGYLEGLRDSVNMLTSYAGEARSVEAAEPAAAESALPAAGAAAPSQASVSRRFGNYAPTQSAVKHMSARNGTLSEGSYMDGLRAGLSALSSFAQARPAAAAAESGPPGETAGPVGAAAAPGTSAHVPPRGLVARRQRGSYAPTQSFVKDLSGRTLSQAGYLEGLRDSVNMLTSYAEAHLIEEEVASQEAAPSAVAPSVLTPPSTFAATTRRQGGSYAPTQSMVKNLSARTLSQAGYLEGLRDGVNMLTSGQRAPSVDASFAGAPPRAFAASSSKRQGSYAPTQSFVKDLSARTLSQAGYLEGLRDGANMLTSYAEAHLVSEDFLDAEDQPAVAAPSADAYFAQRPASAFATQQRGSYAPTQSMVKNLSARTLSQAGYLEGLRDGANMLTSYAEAHLVSDDFLDAEDQPAAPSAGTYFAQTPPSAFATQRQGSYAPTQSMVKNLSARTLSQAGYLEGLRDGVNMLTSYAEAQPAGAAPSAEATPLPTMPAAPKFGGPSFSYAPTKPSVKDVSAKTASQSDYLTGLKQGASGLTSFAGMGAPASPSTSDSVPAVQDAVVEQKSIAPIDVGFDVASFNEIMTDLIGQVKGLCEDLRGVKATLQERELAVAH